MFPSNQHEVQTRRDHFLNTRATLNVLVGQIEVAAEFAPIDGETMREWMGLVRTELNLVKGVLDADKRRYESGRRASPTPLA